jgi:hypothetical protein
VSRFQGETCGNARPHRAQACAPSGGNGLPQPGQCVANRIPQWAQNCQCEAISWRQSRHSWRNWWNSSWSFRRADSSRLSSDGCCCCSSSMVSLPSRIGPLRTAAYALASSRKASICIQTGSECCAPRRVYTSSAPAFIQCIAIGERPAQPNMHPLSKYPSKAPRVRRRLLADYGDPRPPRLFFHEHFKPVGACACDSKVPLFFPGHFVPASFCKDVSAIVRIDFR